VLSYSIGARNRPFYLNVPDSVRRRTYLLRGALISIVADRAP
jgi:hypothetical protein